MWSDNAEISFFQNPINRHANKFDKPRGNNQNNYREIVVKVTSIDALELSGKVTFIKMDIEGSELEALKGKKILF